MSQRRQFKTIEGLKFMPGGCLLVEYGGEPVIKTAVGYQFDGEYYPTLHDLPAGRYRVIIGPAVPWACYWRWHLKERLPWRRMVFRMTIQEGARYSAMAG
jgi:hypothetical protein